MTIKSIKNRVLRLLPVFAMAAVATGCGYFSDDLSDCEDNYAFTIRAYDYQGVQLGRDDVKDVTLFVFDGDSRFLSKKETNINESVSLSTSPGGVLNVVAWGNLREGNQTYTDPQPGDHIDDCFVELKALTRATLYAMSPGDLFRGMITLSREQQAGNVELPIYREVGSMTVTVRGLLDPGSTNLDDYRIEVRETYSKVDFRGNPGGARVAYKPAGSFIANNGNQDYYVPIFNMLPEPSGVAIDIYHGDTLLHTVTQDSTGNIIAVNKGRLTNVLIDFSVSLSVQVAITDWGSEHLWKEFQ